MTNRDTRSSKDLPTLKGKITLTLTAHETLRLRNVYARHGHELSLEGFKRKTLVEKLDEALDQHGSDQ